MTLPPNSEVTCAGAPFQVEGTMPDGQVFYFRARHGAATFDVGATPAVAVSGLGSVSLDSPCVSWDSPEARAVLAQMYAEALVALQHQNGS